MPPESLGPTTSEFRAGGRPYRSVTGAYLEQRCPLLPVAIRKSRTPYRSHQAKPFLAPCQPSPRLLTSLISTSYWPPLNRKLLMTQTLSQPTGADQSRCTLVALTSRWDGGKGIGLEARHLRPQPRHLRPPQIMQQNYHLLCPCMGSTPMKGTTC